MSGAATDISGATRELRSAAIEFGEAIDAAGASDPLPAALTQIEEALRAVSASVHALAHEAVPASTRRNRAAANGRQGQPLAAEPSLSWEQQTHLETTVHDLAQEFSRCARSCAQARKIVLPLIAAGRDAANGG